MFDNYPDEVIHKVLSGEDSFGSPVFEPDVTINARRCRTEKSYHQTNSEIKTIYNIIYHVPMDVVINERDCLDGHTVIKVIPCRGVDNVFHFNKVVCE